MKISRPEYRKLQACRGRPDEEVERLTRAVYQRKPKLAYYPFVVLLVLFPAAMLIPRFLAKRFFGDVIIWPLIIVAVVFGVPVILFERLVFLPAVNREMLKLICEEENAKPPSPES